MESFKLRCFAFAAIVGLASAQGYYSQVLTVTGGSTSSIAVSSPALSTLSTSSSSSSSSAVIITDSFPPPPSTLTTATSSAPASSTTPNSPETPTTYYYLRTQVINSTNSTPPTYGSGSGSGSCFSKSQYNNLYLWAYHTGAGLDDAVVSANRSLAIRGYLSDIVVENGTATGNQTFDFGTEFPWGMQLLNEPYACWSPVEINAGDGDPGFYIDPALGLKVGGGNDDVGGSWGGWLVCDWWHGVPQLFWQNKFYNTPDTACPTPCSCAEVNLIPEYL